MKKNDILSTREVAALMHVSDQAILNWLKDGTFPNAFKLNPSKARSAFRIPRSDVEKALKAQREFVVDRK